MSETQRARAYLIAVGVVLLPLIAIPLFIDPYWWAERFGWDTGPETDLGNYLGRCLGAVALAVVGTAVAASRDPLRHRTLFTVLGTSALLLAVVHLRGLIEDSQPLVEHIETALWAGAGGLAFWCQPSRDQA